MWQENCLIRVINTDLTSKQALVFSQVDQDEVFFDKYNTRSYHID